MKLKIIYFSVLNYQTTSLEILKSLGTIVELPDPNFLNDKIIQEANVVFAPMGYFWGKDFFAKCKKLKFLVSNTTGHPHIDVEAAQKAKIRVITLKDDHRFLDKITPTAEHTIGLMLSLLRGYPKAYSSVLNGDWNRRNHGGTSMISRMTVGIIGFGRLGKKVANICLAFEASVQFYDPNEISASPLIKRCASLKELVSTSDVISLHVPHEAETEGMISRSIFDQFKDGSFLINTSRGELVDENALLECLLNRKLGGAALDVLSNEFDIGFEQNMNKNPLVNYAKKNRNLIITPHIGGSTLDAWSETEKRVIELLKQNLNKSNKKYQITTSEVLAFIPARGGSKSIKLKNMALLDGRPLVEYALNVALKHKLVNRTVCSSDHPAILDLALSAGAEVHKRSDDLSGDYVSTLDVIIDYLEFEHETLGHLPEYLLLLEPTSPFVSPDHIDRLIYALQNEQRASSAQTVTKVQSNSHAFNQRYHDDRGSHFLFETMRKGKFNKQLKPELYIHGNARLMRVESILENYCLFGPLSIPVDIDRISALDVDGAEDLKFAEFVVRERKGEL